MRQLTSKEMKGRLQKFPINTVQATQTTERILHFIVIDGQPLSVMSDKGFRLLIHNLEPRCEIVGQNICPRRLYLNCTVKCANSYWRTYIMSKRWALRQLSGAPTFPPWHYWVEQHTGWMRVLFHTLQCYMQQTFVGHTQAMRLLLAWRKCWTCGKFHWAKSMWFWGTMPAMRWSSDGQHRSAQCGLRRTYNASGCQRGNSLTVRCERCRSMLEKDGRTL